MMGTFAVSLYKYLVLFYIPVYVNNHLNKYLLFRFIPDGIYLDACALGPEQLARQMNNAIVVKKKYYEFFKWRGHYSFLKASETPNTDPICKFCAVLNDVKKRTTTSIHRNTSNWWNQSTVLYNLPTCTISEPTAIKPIINNEMIALDVINSVKNEIDTLINKMRSMYFLFYLFRYNNHRYKIL